jgi:hypothetical protein
VRVHRILSSRPGLRRILAGALTVDGLSDPPSGPRRPGPSSSIGAVSEAVR